MPMYNEFLKPQHVRKFVSSISELQAVVMELPSHVFDEPELKTFVNIYEYLADVGEGLSQFRSENFNQVMTDLAENENFDTIINSQTSINSSVAELIGNPQYAALSADLAQIITTYSGVVNSAVQLSNIIDSIDMTDPKIIAEQHDFDVHKVAMDFADEMLHVFKDRMADYDYYYEQLHTVSELQELKEKIGSKHAQQISKIELMVVSEAKNLIIDAIRNVEL